MRLIGAPQSLTPERPFLRQWARGLSPLVLAAGLQAVPGLAQDSEVITKIEVVGAQKQTPETIIFKTGLKEGDDLRTVDLSAILEKLWATNAFDDIKFQADDQGDGKKLIILVKERPLIKEVDYRGGTEVGLTAVKDKIKEKKLTINPDTVYDPEAARKVKDLLVDQCAEKGFRNPVIDVTLEPMGPTVSRLVFEIKEGGKVRIYKVGFRGNKAISSPALADAMEKTRKHWMFSWLTSHDLLVEKNMEEDIQNVKKAYWRMGYKDVFVGKPTIVVEDHTTARQKKKNEVRVKEGKSPKYDLRAALTIPVLEGETFSEGTFKIEGNNEVMKGKAGEAFYRRKIDEVKRDNHSWMAKLFSIAPNTEDPKPTENRPFDLDSLNGGIDKIKEAYGNMGYIMFRADKKMEVREENGVKKVDVLLKVDEGEMYTVRRVNFEGNVTTKDKVLRRSMPMKEGDPFATEVFKDSFTGLGQLGFFDVKGSEPKVDLVPDKPQVDITIKGEESGVNEVLFQGGYGSVLGFSLGMSFSTRNLGGGGETLSLSYNGGKYQRNASISYSEPYIFDLPYSLSTSISDGTTDYDASRVGAAYAYKQLSRSLGVSMGTRLATFIPGPVWAFFTTYQVGYTFRILQVEGGRNYYFRDTSPQLTSTVNNFLTYSTVNHPFKPTNGTKLSMGLEYGGWQFGGDKPFFRTTFEFAKWTNIDDRHIFGVNASYGFLRNLSDQSLAIWEMYRPGGENSIRGYNYGQVGTARLDNTSNLVVVGGNKQVIINAEYQFKIADQFRIVAFYDAGNAWAEGVKVFSESLRRSAGLEARFFLPISPAPLRLIWAKKLNPYEFDTSGKTQFQFSIGTTF
jgi:outer membrane protein insertion porin family